VAIAWFGLLNSMTPKLCIISCSSTRTKLFVGTFISRRNLTLVS